MKIVGSNTDDLKTDSYGTASAARRSRPPIHGLVSEVSLTGHVAESKHEEMYAPMTTWQSMSGDTAVSLFDRQQL